MVVIGVLGIIAAGLLATIDPLEQLRKGADSNKKEASVELVNAITRYYATKGAMPWATVANGGDNCNGGTAPSATKVSASGMGSGANDCLTVLTNQGELKSTFIAQTQITDKLYVTQLGSSSPTIAVCFDPESKSDSKRAETKYTSAAVADANCPGDGTTVCYWCAQ